MNPILLPWVAIALPFLCFPLSAEESRVSGAGPAMLPTEMKAPGSEVTTDRQLLELRSKAGAVMTKPLPPASRDFSLAALSEFLEYEGQHVILPKGSVIHCPAAMANRVRPLAAGTPVSWTDFQRDHRAWIVTKEVTLAQIRGEVPFSEQERLALEKSNQMVVATFRGNPVTVLNPVPATPP